VRQPPCLHTSSYTYAKRRIERRFNSCLFVSLCVPGAPHEVMGLWGKLWGAQHKALKAEGEEGRPSPLGLGLSPLQFTSADGPSLEALSNAGLTATAINKVRHRVRRPGEDCMQASTLNLQPFQQIQFVMAVVVQVFSRLVADPVYQFVLHTDKPALGVLKQRPLKDEATAFQDFVALGADDRSPSASSSRSTSSSGSTSSQAGSKGHASHVDQEASSARKASKAPAPASDATRLSDQEALLAFASLQGSQVQS
jgi:hypothetical protein